MRAKPTSWTVLADQLRSLILFAPCMDRFQIEPEERALSVSGATVDVTTGTEKGS